jgi:hypothetical protein
MKDIVAVKWLSLGAAVKRLSYPVEKLFLTGVGRHALRQRIRPQRRRGKASLAKAPGVKAASVKTAHAKTANAKKTISAKKTALRRKSPSCRTRA